MQIVCFRNTSFREQENDRRLKHYSQLSEFDKELLHDPQQVSLYAMEIFDYLKSREVIICHLYYIFITLQSSFRATTFVSVCK